jgi:hypothetical protein
MKVLGRFRAYKEKILKNKLKIFLVLLVLSTNLFLIYFPRMDYPYPLHFDEWTRLEEISGENYIQKSIDLSNLDNTRLGFNLFLLMISKVINPVKLFFILPLVWLVVSSLSLFFLIRYLTKNYWISLLSMAFFATLKSNTNILGTWFFLPLTFLIPFCYLTLWLIDRGFETKKTLFFVLALVSNGFVTITHGSIGALLFIILSIYLLTRFNEFKENKLGVAIFLLTPIVALMIFLLLFHSQIEKLISSFIIGRHFRVGGDPRRFTVPFMIYTVYGISALVLGVIGAFYAFKHKEQRVLVIWIIVALIPVLFFYLTGRVGIIRFQRAFYYLMVGLVPLSAIGLYKIIDIVRKTFSKKIAVIITIMLIALVFSDSLSNYYDLESQAGIKDVNVNLYRCYDPKSNDSFTSQMSSGACSIGGNFSSVEPFLAKSIFFP